MTVIAWDGKTLAGDKQSNFNGIRSRTRKVYKVSRGVFGCSGITSECQAYVRWAKNPVIPAPIFTDINILFIDNDLRVWLSDQSGQWSLLKQPVSAIGSGSELAIGAMLAGATAKEAVRLACRTSIYCGMGIDVVRL